MKNILLLSCHTSHGFNVRTFGSILKSRFNVSYLYLVDYSFDSKRPGFADVAAFCSNFDYVLISSSSYTSDYMLTLCDEIKKIKDVKIIIGGPLAITEPAKCRLHADYICNWYGYNIMELFDYIEGKRKNISNFIAEGSDVSFSLPKDLDQIPPPDYSPNNTFFLIKDKVVEKKYYSEGIAVESMHGCLFNCSFCHVAYENQVKKKHGLQILVKKSMKNVISDLRHILSVNKGARYVNVLAENFFSHTVEEISEFVKNYNRYIDLQLNIEADPRSDRFIEKFTLLTGIRAKVELGIGVQSGSKKILFDIFNRYQDNDLLVKNHEKMLKIKKNKNSKIKIFYYFISSLPGEKKKDIVDTINLMLKLKHSTPILYEYTPIPKTPLAESIGGSYLNFFHAPVINHIKENAFYYYYYHYIKFIFHMGLYFMLPKRFKENRLTNLLNSPALRGIFVCLIIIHRSLARLLYRTK